MLTRKEIFLRSHSYYFSAFERVKLNTDVEMHKTGDFIQLYYSSPIPALEPIMHVGFFSQVLYRVLLLSCFMDGSDHPTNPRRFARLSRIRQSRADRNQGTGNGCRLYEVKMWMRILGRGTTRSCTFLAAKRIREAFASATRSLQDATRKWNRGQVVYAWNSHMKWICAPMICSIILCHTVLYCFKVINIEKSEIVWNVTKVFENQCFTFYFAVSFHNSSHSDQ